MTKIRNAREVEKKEKRRKLFPIRLTDFETLRDWTCFDAEWIWHGSALVFRPDFPTGKTTMPLNPPSPG